jgi:hypothetical protein
LVSYPSVIPPKFDLITGGSSLSPPAATGAHRRGELLAAMAQHAVVTPARGEHPDGDRRHGQPQAQDHEPDKASQPLITTAQDTVSGRTIPTGQ